MYDILIYLQNFITDFSFEITQKCTKARSNFYALLRAFVLFYC